MPVKLVSAPSLDTAEAGQMSQDQKCLKNKKKRILHAKGMILSVFLLLVQTELHDLLKPISDHIQEIQSFRERNRGSSFFNHLSAISESIPALGWVAVVRRKKYVDVAACRVGVWRVKGPVM